MFNKNVIDVLSQINGITNSVILKYPTTVAVSDAQDVMISVDVSALDNDSFSNIGLKNSLSDFLSLIKLFPDDRKIEIINNTINISSGRNSSVFITDNIALMDEYDKDPIQFVKTQEVPSVASFDLLVDDIKNLKSASNLFKDLSEIIFTAKDDEIVVSLGATNKFNAKSNTYSVSKNVKTLKEFQIKIPVENFRMIPVSDYVLDIKYNSSRNSYRLMLTNKFFNGFKIIMSLKV